MTIMTFNIETKYLLTWRVFSTSPEAEHPDFLAHLRNTLETMKNNPQSSETLFPGGMSRQYTLDGNRKKWKLHGRDLKNKDSSEVTSKKRSSWSVKDFRLSLSNLWYPLLWLYFTALGTIKYLKNMSITFCLQYWLSVVLTVDHEAEAGKITSEEQEPCQGCSSSSSQNLNTKTAVQPGWSAWVSGQQCRWGSACKGMAGQRQEADGDADTREFRAAWVSLGLAQGQLSVFWMLWIHLSGQVSLYD